MEAFIAIKKNPAVSWIVNWRTVHDTLLMKVQAAFVHINSEKLMNKEYVLAKGEMANAPSG